MGSPLLDKSKAFALRIIKVCNEVKREKKESILTNQLIRSGTSRGTAVPANGGDIFNILSFLSASDSYCNTGRGLL